MDIQLNLHHAVLKLPIEQNLHFIDSVLSICHFAIHGKKLQAYALLFALHGRVDSGVGRFSWFMDGIEAIEQMPSVGYQRLRSRSQKTKNKRLIPAYPE